MKRLQAKDVIQALDIQSKDKVLDFGCGAGFFTVEMAKLAGKAIGIDINPYINTIIIPKSLEERLEFIQASGDALPFENDSFDRILASEILPMLPNPNAFMQEIKRVLKPGGKLVISNGAGHPAIEEAYEKPGWVFKLLQKKFPERVPSSYAEYCSILQKSFGTGQERFLGETDIEDLLTKNGFSKIRFDFTPGKIAGSYFSWSQFLLYLRKGKTLSQRNFVFNYFLFTFIRLFEKKRYKGGLLCISEKATTS